MSYNPYMRRRNFATTNPVGGDTGTYAGEAADFFVAPAILGADTIANNWATPLSGIQWKAVVNGASIQNDIIQAAGCDWNDGNSVTIDERVLTLSDLMVNEALCRGVMLPTWQGMTGARDSMPWSNDSFRNFIIATIAAKVAERVELAIWRGGAVTGQKGFLSNDGDVTNLADLTASTLNGATQVTILTPTSGTAIAEFNKVYTKMAETTPAVLTKSDVAFYVSPKTYALYCQQLAGLGSAVSGTTGQGINNQATAQSFLNVGFMGIPIHVTGGVTDNIILLTQESNLFVGSNLQTDYTQARYIDAWQFDGSDNVKVSMRFGLGTQTGRPAEAVIGRTFTT